MTHALHKKNVVSVYSVNSIEEVKKVEFLSILMFVINQYKNTYNGSITSPSNAHCTNIML